MKRRVIIALVISAMLFLFMGCDPSVGNDRVSLSPPSWLIGTWYSDNDLRNYEFSSDNVIYSVYPSYGDAYSVNFAEAYYGKSVSEDNTTTEYSIVIILNSDSACTFSFSKLSDSTIECSHIETGVGENVDTFTKK